MTDQNVSKRKQKRNRNRKTIDPNSTEIIAMESVQTFSTISQNSDSTNDDGQKNGKNAVSRKIKKRKIKSSKKHKKYETINEREKEENDNESLMPSEDAEELNFGYEGNHIQFHNDLDMLQFRTKLRTTNFIPDLRHFLCLMEHNTRIVSDYIKMFGRPLELAESLEYVNQKNLLDVSYICQALEAVLMEIISNHPAYIESAVIACQYIFKEHSNVIGALLESVEIKHRRIALKLLTAFVNVGPQIGRLTLSTFKIFSDVRKINQYLSHSKSEQLKFTQETVRQCYIKFVLAFMVDIDSLLIQSLLNRRTIIHALISGLLYDDHSTVCLVLNTLKKFVLENVSISKNTKIHIFDLECCKCLVRLYDWCGPRELPSKLSKTDAAFDKSLSKSQLCLFVRIEEKEAVAATVHEFLLTLLSSDTHGIYVDATRRPWQKHNAVQGKIINFIAKPWFCERKTALIHKILTTNPEFARQTVCHFSKIIRKHTADDGKFMATANFLAGIITILHPDVLRNVLKQITLTDLTYWIKDICLPLETLTALRNSNMLLHSNIECRLATHRLLLAMFMQYSNFMIAAMQRVQAKGGSSNLRRFKFDLYNHMLTNFPSVDHILQSLNLTMSTTALHNSSTIMKHLNVTLDLILIICKYNRSIVNMTGTILDYLKLIRPLYAGEEDGDDILKRQAIWANYHDIKIELKGIKTILLLNPSALNSNQELLSHVLRSFIKIFVYGNGDVQRESGNLLKEIFKSAGIFDTSELEIDLWLEALRWSEPVTVEVVTKVLMEVLKVDHSGIDLPADIENVKTHPTFAISKLLLLILKSVQNVQPLDAYIEKICLLLFHFHPKPAVVTKLYEIKFKTLSKYMNTWMSPTDCPLESKDLVLPKVCERIPYLKDLQSALLTGYMKSNFTTIFGNTNDEMSFEIEVEQKKYKLSKVLKNERLLMIYIQQMIFLVTQLFRKQQLMRQQAEFAAKCIINFLAILHEMEKENRTDDISYIEEDDAVVNQSFLSRILAYMYDIRFDCLGDDDICYAKTEHNLHYIYFITLITEYCNKLSEFFNYVKNFRLKIVKAVAISTKTVELTKKQSYEDFIKMVEAFQLNAENCLELLELLCKNLKHTAFFVRRTDDNGFQPSFYYKLLIYLLRHVTELKKEVQCENIVKELAKYYVCFTKKLNGQLNLEDFGEAFYDFLCTKQQYIPNLDFKIFACMFVGHKIKKSNVKLACLFLQRNNNFNEHFLNLLHEHIGKKELIYPLLEIWFNKNISLDESLQMTIYHEYGVGLLEAIEKPQKADDIYKDHVACSIKLINNCMPITDCMDFCKKNFQFNDSTELYQIRLIHAIYEKAWNALKKDEIDERTRIFVNYLSLQIQLLSNDLQRKSLTMDKLQLFAFQIFSWLAKIQRLTPAVYYGFGDIIKSQYWLNFFNGCLELCMQTDDTTEISDTQNGLLLKFVAYLCDKLFIDYGNTKVSRRFQPKEPVQLFVMLCTHSKFYDILLSPKATQVKTAIFSLLFALAKKSPTLTLEHLKIPIIFNAYHAEFTESDRYILALLKLYEVYYPREFQLHRPSIWNKKAISLNDINFNPQVKKFKKATT